MDKPPNMEHDWFPVPLPANVTLGERSWCYSSFSCLHYQSRRGIRVGHDSGIYHGSFFELGPDGEVEIGNFCTLVGAIIASNRKITIGDYTLIAHEVVLADSFAAIPPALSPEYRLPSVVAETDRSPAILIGHNCWIGARAIILAGARLGEGAIVGAGAVVDFEVPPHTVVAGNPASVVGSASPGMRSRGLNIELWARRP